MIDVAEQDRLRGDVAREGVVVSVDHAARRCVVRIADDFETQPIPWFAFASGQLAAWRPPSPGEQGMVISPDGEIGRAVFLPGIYSDANAPPAALADAVVLTYGDMRVLLRGDALVLRAARADDQLLGGIIVTPERISLRLRTQPEPGGPAGEWKHLSIDTALDRGITHSGLTAELDPHQVADEELLDL